jgi:hypothetical protein
VSLEANIVERLYTIGDERNQLQLGISRGKGWAFNVYYGDVNGNGVREYGLSVDYDGIFLGFKSEYIGHAYNAVTKSWEPLLKPDGAPFIAPD